MPFLEPCAKTISADGPYADFEWFGDTIWNGVSTSNGPALFTGYVAIGERKYHVDTSQLELIEIDGVTYFLLRAGRYIFTSPTVVVTRPFYVDLSATAGTCEITGTLVYVDAFATGKAFVNGDINVVGSSLSIVRITSSVLVNGGSPTAAAVSMTSTSGTGVFIGSFVGIAGWISPSLVNNFSIVDLNSINIQQCAAGFEIRDTNSLVSLVRLNMSSSLAAMTYVRLTATVFKAPLVTISGTTFVPANHVSGSDYGIFISTIAEPNVSIFGGVYDDRLLGTSANLFFEPGGYTQRDPNVVLGSVKNVESSAVSVEISWQGNEVQNTTVQNQWSLVEFPLAGVLVSSEQRISEDSYYVVRYEGREAVTLRFNCNLTLAGLSAIDSYAVGLFRVDDAINGVASSTGNVITSTVHGLLNGYLVWFGNNGVTGIDGHLLYYVVNSTANTFQISASSGGAPIALGNGSVVFQRALSEAQPSQVAVGNNVVSQVSVFALGNSNTGDRFTVCLRNISGTKAVSMTTFSFSVS